MPHNVFQRAVQVSDPEGLPRQPGPQIQHHKPAVGLPFLVDGIEALLDHFDILADGNPPVPQTLTVEVIANATVKQDFALVC